MNFYVIQDEETGNFVSSDSIFVTKHEVIYSTHSGRADGLEYHNSFVNAEKVLHKIKNKLEKYNVHKNFRIVEVIKENMHKGRFVKVLLSN